MSVNRKRLVFFERWFDPVAEKILGAEDDIELVKLRYADPEPENWDALRHRLRLPGQRPHRAA